MRRYIFALLPALLAFGLFSLFTFDAGAVELDPDGDGVVGRMDFCADTEMDEPTVSLGTNRWIWNEEDWETLKPKGKGPMFDLGMEDVYGCSCTQILNLYHKYTGAEMEGHYKFGCSKSVMEGAPMFIRDIMDGEYDGYICEDFDHQVVPSTSMTGVNSKPLTAGNMYRLDVSGTYKFANMGAFGIADAEYSYRNDKYGPIGGGWAKGEDTFPAGFECYLDLQVDGCVDWGDRSLTNEYSLDYMGAGLPLHLFIADDAYGDNVGSLDVHICEMVQYEL